jgi:hypothetical protein
MSTEKVLVGSGKIHRNVNGKVIAQGAPVFQEPKDHKRSSIYMFHRTLSLMLKLA